MTRRSDRTIAARRELLDRVARFAGCPAADVTAGDLRRWRQSIDSYAPITILTYVTHLRMFYRWLITQGYRDDDPTAGLPVPSAPIGIPKPISEADLMAAVASAPERIRPWLVLAGWCGLRAKEIAYLKAENVRLDRSPPVIVVAADATKGRRERVIPLPPYVVAELGGILPSGGWVFGRMDGKDGPNTPHRVTEMVSKYLARQGIDATLHAGRHRYGTQLYRNTKDLRLVQDALGHRSPVTTAIYTKVEMAETYAAVAGLPAPA